MDGTFYFTGVVIYARKMFIKLATDGQSPSILQLASATIITEFPAWPGINIIKPFTEIIYQYLK